MDKALMTTVCDDFNQIVSQYANRIAVRQVVPSSRSNLQQLTYHDLNRMARQCEHAIRCQTGLDFAPIIVSLDEDIRLFALFLGIMKSGRPYFYIDPKDPTLIKEALIDQMRPTLLIGDPIRSNFPLVCLDIETVFTFDESPDYQDVEVMAPCCLVQTSGTTNQARARSISHHVLRHNSRNYQKALTINTNDRLSLLTTPKFSAANSAIYGALLSGACLCPFSMKANGLLDLVQWISDEQITLLHLTPSLFRLLLNYVPAYSLPSLRAIKLGGESLYPADVALFKAKFSPHCVLVNGLGMSEIGGNVSFFIMHHETYLPPDTQIVPVGQALDGHEIRIIDEEGRQLETGKTGEIVIRSAFLSKAFPSVTHESTTELHTNDLGYFLPDGVLVHVGRKNRIIKRHGLRVDLNLIESALLDLDKIKNAVVYFTSLKGSLDVLVACVQLVENNSVDSDTIRQALGKLLPVYMIPQVIFFMEDLLLTRSGKIDHQGMLRHLRQMQITTGRVEPRNELEQQLSNLWQSIFKRDDIGIYDNFYELGGTSLLSMELMARLSQDLSITYSIDVLTSNPTIAQLAEDIKNGTQQSQILQASLQRLDANTEDKQLPPLIFMPGGAMSEKELLLMTGLLPYLNPNRAALGIRLNLLAKGTQVPASVEAIAAIIVDTVTGNVPILIGECLACVLTLEVARQLSKKIGIFPSVILLNPWHPRLLGEQPTDTHLLAIENYSQLLKWADPAPYAGSINLVLAQDQQRTMADCIDWWSSRTNIEGSVHTVPGDNKSYIRLYRRELAQKVNAILRVCKS